MKKYNNTEIFNFLKKIREYFYILFITNLDVKKILNHFLLEFKNRFEDIRTKQKIIDIIAEF